MSDLIKTEISDRILTVTINRPEKKNALTMAMYDDLCLAYKELAENDDLRVMILTGAGDSFTSGNDIQDFLVNTPRGPDAPVFKFLRAFLQAEKPVIMAVNGIAVGVGTTMLMHADFVYASEAASFIFPFVNLALVPEAASSKILPDMVGHRKAAELFMLGEPFSAECAKEYGIINDIVAGDELMTKARETALKLAAKPPEALRLTKKLMKTDYGSLEATMDEESRVFGERLTSPEAIEALTAFMENRKPDFSKFK